MQCFSCQTTLREQAWFCTDCGTPVSHPCSACGSSLEPDDRFCGNCGCPAHAPEPAARPGPGRPEGFLPL
ncbi:MAG: zinc ribbon domain-containing protein [Myxococcota bacterium]